MNRNSIRVLLIEDNPGDARLIQEMLAEGKGWMCALECVESLAAGLLRIMRGDIDVVLLDLGLPDSAGLDTLRRLRSGAPQEPVVVVMSGLSDEEVGMQAVQEGAQDYLVKGQVGSGLLIRSIRYAIERSEAEKALRQARDELESQVRERTASLTHAVESLEKEIAERRRAEEALNRLNEELEQRVRERTKELERRNYELEQMNKVFVGRELRMVELKERIRELENRVGERSK
jgi:DNA-binding response OmpR family regulator